MPLIETGRSPRHQRCRKLKRGGAVFLTFGSDPASVRGQLSQGLLLRSWNRATHMALIRYYSAFFQDQLQTPHIGDVLERIGPDHNQVGELAHLHRAQFGPDAAHFSAMARGRYQRPPRRRAVANPQPHLEKRGVLERTDVRAQRHSYTGINCFAEPRGVHVRRCLGTTTQRMREPALHNPARLRTGWWPGWP